MAIIRSGLELVDILEEESRRRIPSVPGSTDGDRDNFDLDLIFRVVGQVRDNKASLRLGDQRHARNIYPIHLDINLRLRGWKRPSDGRAPIFAQDDNPWVSIGNGAALAAVAN